MQLVQLTKQSEDIRKLFAANAQRMTRAAPKGFDPNRLVSVAFNAIAYNTDLLGCSRESLIGGAFEAIKLGLTLGGPMQEAWLIPFNQKGGKVATLIIGYQGYRNLIDRARAVLDLHPRAVHNGLIKDKGDGWSQGTPDEFDYWYGDEPRIVHRPMNEMPQYKNQLRAVYCVARLRGGGKQMEVLELAEIEAHRERSRAREAGPWVTDYVPMALKTAVRKIAKYLPKASMELSRAMALDNAADAGETQPFEIDSFVIPEVETAEGPAAPPTKAIGKLKEKLQKEQKAPKAPEATPTDKQPELTDADINWGN